jgi:membrane-associated phospholipid phosphatase
MSRSEKLQSLRRWAPHLAAGIVLAVLLAWDRPIYDAIQVFSNPFLNVLTTIVAQMRGAVFPILVAVSLIAWGVLRSRTKFWRAGIALLLVLMLSGAVVSILKPTFARSGPGHQTIPKPGKSWIASRYGRFPSSHAALLFGSATALAVFLPATAPAGFGVALLVCYERLYRDAHYPSDIFAGAWIGILIAKFVVGWLARRESWRDDLSPFWLHRRRSRREETPAPSALGGPMEIGTAVRSPAPSLHATLPPMVDGIDLTGPELSG